MWEEEEGKKKGKERKVGDKVQTTKQATELVYQTCECDFWSPWQTTVTVTLAFQFSARWTDTPHDKRPR